MFAAQGQQMKQCIEYPFDSEAQSSHDSISVHRLVLAGTPSPAEHARLALRHRVPSSLQTLIMEFETRNGKPQDWTGFWKI
jgi:hypothetical protein